MKKLIIVVIAVIVGISCFYALYRMDKNEEARCIRIMETQSEFTRDEIDSLWHFKNEHNCSEKFLKLYDQKIKPL